MKKLFVFFPLVTLLLFSATSIAQGRSWIRDQITEKGNCRNVAITVSGGDLMLYGRNGWAAKGCPESLTDALQYLNDNDEYIDDVQLTEDGRWLILYGNNGIRWNDIPYSLEQKLREYNEQREVILSVTFNDYGNWIVITKNYFSASDTEIQQWLKEGNDKYGMLWSACITDDAMVAVYKNGYKFFGNTPPTLKNGLDRAGLDVYRLKIAGKAWFIADVKGRYDYYM